MAAIDNFKTDDIVLSNINQDIIPKQVVMQGEKDGRSLTVQVRNGGIVEPQAGLNLNLGWKHRTAKDANGDLIQGLDAFKPIDREKGIFRIEYSSSMAQPGTIDAEIQFVTGNSITKSQPFIITVKPSTVDESAVESESSFTVLQEMLAHVSEYDEKINSIEIKKADRSDIAKVEDMVSRLPTGTPREPFDSLGELQAKYPNGSEYAMLVYEGSGENKKGYVYLWNGKIWQKGGAYSESVIGDKSITKPKLADKAVSYLKTDFLEVDNTINLFDGEYTTGIKVSGVVPTLKIEKTGISTDVCAVIQIEPNTTYYLGRQGDTRLNLGTSSKSLDEMQNTETLSGYQYSGQVGGPSIISFKSKDSDKYLFVNVSLVGEKPFLKVTKDIFNDFGDAMYPVRPRKDVDILSKTEFADSLDRIVKKGNLVTESWIHGFRLGGSGNQTAYVRYEGGSMKVQEIEPNKNYWVARKHTGRFKIATTTKPLSRDALVDGAILIVTVDDEQVFSFTTGNNDRYLYIDAINDGSEPYLLLTDRAISSPDDIPSDSYVPAETLQVFSKQETLALIGKKKGGIDASYNNVSKTFNIDVPVPNGYVRYQYTFISNSSINYQQWRVFKTYKLDNTKAMVYDLDAHTEWEGAIKEVGAEDFMGGWHGDETNTSIQVLIDGKPRELTEDFKVVDIQEVKIVNLSLLNRVGDTSKNLLKRARVNTWTEKKYTVENKFDVLEDFEIDRSMLTMLSCSYMTGTEPIVEYGRSDHDFLTYAVKSPELAAKKNDVTTMELWGNNLYCKASAEYERNKYPNSKQWIEDFGYRAKIYFDITGNYSAKAGDVIRVKSIYEVR